MGDGKLKPLVSVIIPVYNAEKFIDEAIESVLNQTYTNFELILIEDASTDRTTEKLKKYKDKRIHIYENEVNRGISYSTNKGITVSNGKYIALMDDDDVMEKERLFLEVEFLERNIHIDIVGGRTTYIAENGNLIDYSGIPRNNPKYIKAMLLIKCLDFMNGTAMIRKEFIEKNNLKYDDNCFGMQDFKFYIDSSKVGNISSIENFCLKHRIHEHNETTRNFKIYENQRRIKYAELQKYSLERSGYFLNEMDIRLINKVFAERYGKCESKKELVILYKLFQKILQQGIEMHIDYLNELKHFFKVSFSEQIVKLNDFL